MAKKKHWSQKQAGVAYGFRSGLEERVAEQIKTIGLDPQYEEHKLPYTKPATNHFYRPDFWLPKKDGTIMVIETKGRFLLEDRKKMVLVKAQHPELDIRFIFTRSRSPLRKGAKTTYANWCDKEGFLYCDKELPDDWISELL